MSDEIRDTGLSPNVVELLAEEATWADPPAGVEAGILEAIADAEPGPGVGGRLVPLLVVGAAVMAFIFTFAAGWFEQAAPTEYQAALAGSELAPDVDGMAIARPDANGWWIRLDLIGLPPADDQAFYEGWVWSGEDTVSVGTFHMRGGDGSVVLWSGVNLEEYPTLLVTLQRVGAGFAPSEMVMLTGEFSGEDSG